MKQRKFVVYAFYDGDANCWYPAVNSDNEIEEWYLDSLHKDVPKFFSLRQAENFQKVLKRKVADETGLTIHVGQVVS